MHEIDALIKRLPKCELHIHIEGSLEPELMLALARRNGVRLKYESVDAVRQAYRFRNLQDFLDIYYQGMSVLITEQDFYDLAFAYLQRAHADNVRHVEMFFDPQGHTARGIAFGTVIGGLHRAIADAEHVERFPYIARRPFFAGMGGEEESGIVRAAEHALELARRIAGFR